MLDFGATDDGSYGRGEATKANGCRPSAHTPAEAANRWGEICDGAEGNDGASKSTDCYCLDFPDFASWPVSKLTALLR
jgi:hypothetical protein